MRVFGFYLLAGSGGDLVRAQVDIIDSWVCTWRIKVIKLVIVGFMWLVHGPSTKCSKTQVLQGQQLRPSSIQSTKPLIHLTFDPTNSPVNLSRLLV